MVAPIRQTLLALRTSASVKLSPPRSGHERAARYCSLTPDTCTVELVEGDGSFANQGFLLRAGSSSTLRVFATVGANASGSLQNDALARVQTGLGVSDQGAGNCPLSGSNTICARSTVSVQASTDIEVTVSDGATSAVPGVDHAYTVVVRLASGGTADAVTQGGGGAGTGYTIYSSAFLVMMVPHSVATVSLATAMLPRLSAHAADGDLAGVGRNVASTLRTTLALIVPVAAVLPLVADDVANVIWGYAAASDTYEDFAVALSLFAPGLVFFTSHYLMLRGFYALERTRTVFWVQCVIAAVNVALAVTLVSAADPAGTAPGLVTAYAGAYAVGALGSYLLLRHVLGGLETPQLLRFLARLAVATAGAVAVGWAVRAGLEAVWPGDAKVQAVAGVLLVGGATAATYLLLSRALRVPEVTAVLGLVTRRRGR